MTFQRASAASRNALEFFEAVASSIRLVSEFPVQGHRTIVSAITGSPFFRRRRLTIVSACHQGNKFRRQVRSAFALFMSMVTVRSDRPTIDAVLSIHEQLPLNRMNDSCCKQDAEGHESQRDRSQNPCGPIRTKPANESLPFGRFLQKQTFLNEQQSGKRHRHTAYHNLLSKHGL